MSDSEGIKNNGDTSREKALAKNTLLLSFGTFLPKVVSFVTLPILTGCLSNEEYGTYDLVLVLAALFLPAVTLQIQMGAFRYLIDSREDPVETKRIISSTLAFVLPLSCIALIILALVLSGYDNTIKLLFCLFFLFDILSQTVKQCARGLGENSKYAIAAIVSAVTQLVFVSILVLGLGLTLVGALMALTIAEILSIIYLLISTKIPQYFDYRLVSKSTIKEMLSYSWPMVPNTMAMWAMRMSNRVVITIFMGVTANAAFAVAYRIPQILTLIQNAFNMAWQENASLAVKDNDSAEYYTTTFKTIFGIISGMTALLIAAIPVLFAILIRGDYSESYNQIPILVIAMYFYCIATFVGGIYVAYFKSKSVGITTVVAAAINLALDILLIPYLGLYAASLAMLFSCAVLAIYRMIDVKRIVAIRYSVIEMLVSIAIITMQCLFSMQQTFSFDVINCLIALIFALAINKTMVSIVLKKMVRRNS